ncbi:MAG TPA: exodeoxyribonuclease III [Thermoanaerobaculia bacterium]|nr:exodeoxyribonuclease III [Thermoanaerobaculia bacterium]
MKIATWNVNGIRARHEQFAAFVASEQPDVICLQEIKAKIEQVPQTVCDLPGYTCYWHGAGGYSGVALHIRRSSFAEEPQFSHPEFDHETRIVQAAIGDTVYASVYVPNGGKDYDAKIAFMNSLIGYAKSITGAGRKLVICGDYNVARTDMDVHPKERKPNIIGQRPEERELLEAIIGQGLVDVGRMLYPDDENYFTWWAPWRSMRQRNIGWRLDYVLASESLAKRAVSCPSYREIGTSDHAPVVATFS